MPQTHRPAFLVLEADSAGRTAATGARTFHINLGPSRLRKRELAVAAASWEWDGKRATAQTSETGFIPLYYTANSNRFAISTSLTTIRDRAGLTSLNWPAIVTCLATGQFLGSDTPLEGVHVLPIRSSLTWQDRKLEVKTAPLDIDRSSLDFEAASSRYISEVRDAVYRNLPEGSGALALSGGRDSRHILLELLRQYRPPEKIVTSGHYLTSSMADTSVATALGKRAGLAVRQVRPIPDRIRAEVQKNLLVESMTLSHSWALPLINAMSTSTARFDGMNAGVLFGRSGVMVALRSRFGDVRPQMNELVNAAIELMLDSPLARLRAMLEPGLIVDEMADEARSRMRRELLRFAEYPNPVQAYLHFNHTTRDTALFTYRMFDNPEVACPFDDVAMARFGLGLPWSVSTDRRLQSEALRAEFSEFADIPFDEDWVEQPASIDWGPSTEAQTAVRLLDCIEEAGQFRLTEPFEASLRSGKAQLRTVQIATYLCQLLGSDDL